MGIWLGKELFQKEYNRRGETREELEYNMSIIISFLRPFKTGC
jgi:hypothetical protein